MVRAVSNNRTFTATQQMTMLEAAQTLLDNFALFDTAAGIGGRDGLIGKQDLRAITQNKGLPSHIRQAAWLLLENPAVMNRFDQAAGVGGQDGIIGAIDLKAVIRDESRLARPGRRFDQEIANRRAAVNTITQPRTSNAQPARRPRNTARADAPRVDTTPAKPKLNRVNVGRTAGRLRVQLKRASVDEAQMFRWLRDLNGADRIGTLEALGGDLEAVIQEMLCEGSSAEYSEQMGHFLADLARDARFFPDKAGALLGRILEVVDKEGGSVDDDTIREMIGALGSEAEQLLAQLPASVREQMTNILKEGNYSAEDRAAVEVVNRASYRASLKLRGPFPGRAPDAEAVSRTAAYLVEQLDRTWVDESEMFSMLQKLNPQDRLATLEVLGVRLEAVMQEMLCEGSSGEHSEEMGQLLATLVQDAELYPDLAGRLLTRVLEVVDEHGGSIDDDTIRTMVQQLGPDADVALSRLPANVREKMIGILKEGWYSDDDEQAVETLTIAGDIAAIEQEAQASKPVHNCDLSTPEELFEEIDVPAEVRQDAEPHVAGGSEAFAILNDTTLTVEDKVAILLALIMQNMDKDIEKQLEHIASLQEKGVRRMAGTGQPGGGASGASGASASGGAAASSGSAASGGAASAPYYDATADAKAIYEAVDGLGTDEEKIYSTLVGKTPQQVQAIRLQYLAKYGETLDAALEGDLDSTELKYAQVLLRGTRAPSAGVAASSGGVSAPGAGAATGSDPAAKESQKAAEKKNDQTIDIETIKLKRMIDKRGQMFDTFRQIVDKYNETAKGVIQSIGR